MGKYSGNFNGNFNGVNSKTSPCKNCTKRYVGCHGDCLEYMDWRQAVDTERERVQELKQHENMIRSDQIYRCNHMKKTGVHKDGRR